MTYCISGPLSGPWWWSNGQRSCLLLRRSEFQSRWLLHKFSVRKDENKQKKTPGLAHLFYKRTTWGGDLHLGSYLFHLGTHRLEYLWLFMQENDAQLQ